MSLTTNIFIQKLLCVISIFTTILLPNEKKNICFHCLYFKYLLNRQFLENNMDSRLVLAVNFRISHKSNVDIDILNITT